MLSINIPVFNVEVGELVGQVAQQAQQSGIDYEIRVYDDGSEESVKQKNRHLGERPGIIYQEMPENLGRSGIRNTMGLDSEKSYLLFIDSDSLIEDENYLETYLKQVSPGCVLCGGTRYKSEKPDNPDRLLRWIYGRKREAIPAKKRNSQKGFIITSNNFLIDREVFSTIHFRENIGNYGHEDTLLGYDLFRHGIKPFHIDNPVIHTGLEDSVTYLAKTREALENLWLISDTTLLKSADFYNQVNFLKQYNKITRLFPPSLLQWFFTIVKKPAERILTGPYPILFILDFYKLGYYARVEKRGLSDK